MTNQLRSQLDESSVAGQVGKTHLAIALGYSGMGLAPSQSRKWVRFQPALTMSARADSSVTKLRRSALFRQARLACPDAKRARFSHNDRTKDGARLTRQRTRRLSGYIQGASQARSIHGGLQDSKLRRFEPSELNCVLAVCLLTPLNQSKTYVSLSWWALHSV